ncbi:hypothetical protein EDEG_05106, partial [Edhazardia aedis USNM 41457]
VNNCHYNITQNPLLESVDISGRQTHKNNFFSSDSGKLKYKINYVDSTHKNDNSSYELLQENSSYTNKTEEEPILENLISALVDKFYCNPNITPTLLDNFIDKNASIYTDNKHNSNYNCDFSSYTNSKEDEIYKNGILKAVTCSENSTHDSAQENSSFSAIDQFKNYEDDNFLRRNYKKSNTNDSNTKKTIFQEKSRTRIYEHKIANQDSTICKIQKTSENAVLFNQKNQNQINSTNLVQPEQNYTSCNLRYNSHDEYLDLSKKQDYYNGGLLNKNELNMLKLNQLIDFNNKNANSLGSKNIINTVDEQQIIRK